MLSGLYTKGVGVTSYGNVPLVNLIGSIGPNRSIDQRADLIAFEKDTLSTPWHQIPYDLR